MRIPILKTFLGLGGASVLAFSLACGTFTGSTGEDPVTPPVQPEPVPTSTAGDPEDDTECCCAYIQETSQEKAYDRMVARNCRTWGFECVDDGFCDGTVTPDPAPAPAPTPAPAATPDPEPAVTAPAPTPRPTTSRPSSPMTRPGTTAPTSTRPSSGTGMTRPGTTRPTSTAPSSGSTRPSSGGGMTRPR